MNRSKRARPGLLGPSPSERRSTPAGKPHDMDSVPKGYQRCLVQLELSRNELTFGQSSDLKTRFTMADFTHWLCLELQERPLWLELLCYGRFCAYSKAMFGSFLAICFAW
jgi:hypothetical protein